jgi:hypothetical protein
MTLRLATATRVVRKTKGSLVVTRAGRHLGPDDLEQVHRLVEALDQVGIVSAYLPGSMPSWWARLAPFFDQLFVPLTRLLLAVPDTDHVPFTRLSCWTYGLFEDSVPPDQHLRHPRKRLDVVMASLSLALRTLERVGVLAFTPTRDGVALTPAGRWILCRHLIDVHGIALRPRSEPWLVDLDFESLLHACRSSPSRPDTFRNFQRVQEETKAWITHRGDQALPQLLITARATPNRLVQNIITGVIAQHFADDAHTAVRSLLDCRTARGAALVWLVLCNHEPATALTDPDPLVFTDVLALTLLNLGPAEMIAVFDQAGDPDTRTALVQRLPRQPTPSAGPVLDTLSHHPDPGIATAAQRAALQHASPFN